MVIISYKFMDSKLKITKEVKKTNTKEKAIGLIGWIIAIGLIVYLVVK